MSTDTKCYVVNGCILTGPHTLHHIGPSKAPREFTFTVMPEEYGFNICWDMSKCNFHDGKKLIAGEVHVIEKSAYDELKDTPGGKRLYSQMNLIEQLQAQCEKLAAVLRDLTAVPGSNYQANRALSEYEEWKKR